MSVLLFATLDTKHEEARFVRDRLRAAGVSVTVVDVGSAGPPGFEPDVPREQVFQPTGERGESVKRAAEGAAKLAGEWHRTGRLSGVFGLGGSAGTTIGTAAMRALPIGVPKLMVSTLASGDVRPFVDTRDVMMMYSVVDLAGLNRVSRRVLANAADAMAGMVRGRDPSPQPPPRSGEGEPSQDPAVAPPRSGEGLGRGSSSADRPVIVATMFGVTTLCVTAARSILEAAGYEVLVFHATGTGGRTMEGLVRDGLVAGVLDITTTELADQLVGGVMAAGPDRLTAAALAGVPQVISVGALDMVNFGPMASVPEKFKGRRLHVHNPSVTLMRTTPEEMDALAKEIAEKAAAARGPVRVLVPLKGVSALDTAGQPFHWPEADTALFQSLRNWVYPSEMLVEVDAHINDPAFAATAANELLRMLR